MQMEEKKKPIMMSFRAPPELWHAIKTECLRQRITTQEFFQEAAERYLILARRKKGAA